MLAHRHHSSLVGEVSRFFLKQLAHVLVADVVGVEEVANRLEVHYPPASRGLIRAEFFPTHTQCF
jgi:hypothetical protein